LAVGALVSFLDLPPCASERAEAWRQLVGSGKLYASLLQAVRERDVAWCEAAVGKLARWGDECLAYPAGRAQLGPAAIEQWAGARLLAWCAASAARGLPGSVAQSIRRIAKGILPAVAEVPEFVWENRGTAQGWIRTFQERPVLGQVLIPVALCDERDDIALVADLELEVLEGGDCIFLHPEDALATRPGPEFAAALRDAWAGANAAVLANPNLVGRCGRYRLRWRGAPVAEVDGRSAGGAAARGWWHALQGLNADDGVVVLARLEPNSDGRFQLAGVAGIANKVRAVINELPRADTLVVADADDRKVALQCLSALRLSRAIRVIDLTQTGSVAV
jgi:hypothetical protein